MKVTFLGTRGNIDVRSPRHRRHTASLVSYRSARVMIDCGADWLGAVDRIKPSAIVVTHAHPDHVDGLRDGAASPVYAPAAVWPAIARWPIRQRHRLRLRMPTDICGILFEAFPLEHSVIAPAVGYRITAGRVTVFYAPDVLRIRQARTALKGIRVYIGDGATVSRPIVRIKRRRKVAVGHAPITTQLDWCANAGVTRAIFTHCGRAIVAAGSSIEAQILELGRARSVDTRIAHDEFQVLVRATKGPPRAGSLRSGGPAREPASS
jgi:phosphoribosyl 1,2-cyclic phosphodiesterase